MKKLILLNIYAFLFWLVALSLSNFDMAIFRYLKSFSSLIITLALVGINLTALIQLFRNQLFSKIEILSISSILALLIAPLLITLEYTFLGWLSPNLPFINSAVIFIFLLLIFYKKKNFNLENFNFLNFQINKDTILKIIQSPLFWVSILYFLITAIIFSAFYALPDLDPFYWIRRYSKDFSEGVIVRLTSDRPLFSALLYFLNQGAHIDLYAAFKYVLPLFSVLTLIPAWLIARKFPSKLLQTIILLLPLTSSSTILYSQTPMPQAISIISIYFFFFFLIYSWLFNKNTFYYLAGATAFLSFFYHEVAAILFISWLFVTLISGRKFIPEAITKNRLITLLIILLLSSNAFFLKNQIAFLFHWTEIVINSIFVMKLNFLFPAYYINMNGQSMGWGDSIGVIKYYLYYAGPTILILLFSFIYLFIRNNAFRELTINLKKHREIVVLALCFSIFFSISEVLPRLSSTALLPDRSWVFTGIFSLTLFFIITKIDTRKIKVISIITLLGVTTSIGGALYINSLKKYMITNEKLSSAEWIKSNLPNNRVIFTDMERNLLQYYGNSKTQSVPTNFYYDIDATLAEINKSKIGKENLENNYSLFIKTSRQNLEELNNKNLLEQKDSILALLDENIQESMTIASLLRTGNIEPENQKKMYIYYSKANKKDPYISRPYYSENTQGKRRLIFDQYPDKFKKIYFDEKNNIIIWEVL